MPPVTIPLSIAAALPFAGQIASSLLTDDRQKPAINALIAAVFLLLVAVVCYLLTGNFTGNVASSIVIIIAYCALLMHGSLGTLMQFFEVAPSPLANAIFGKPTTQPVPAAAPLVVQRLSTPAPASMASRPVQPPRTTGG
jgi:hypothetical protein